LGPEAQAMARAHLSACLAGYRQLVTYQPASRYWGYQWAELAIFAGLALLLAGFSVWWVRRHPS